MSLQPSHTCASEMHGSIPIADYKALFQASVPVRDCSPPYEGKILEKWSEAAEKRGYTITKRVKDRLHVSLLCHMARLRPYLDHGILELDNNTAERAMRSVAIGRKNYLFVGSQAGGKAAAIAYTLIETAKLNGIDPQAWLADTLARIPDYKINRVDDLLPWKTAS